MIQTEHYDNLADRAEKVALWEAQGFTMLHDNFDPDWQKGDEPHGTLTFTDQPTEPSPTPEPLVFAPVNPVMGVEPRLNYVEEFLRAIYHA